MATKKLTVVMMAALITSVGFVLPAMAQKTPQAGTNITVSKIGPAMFTTIQAAVNAAKPGEVIEILDVSTYNEQVTIDGREDTPWSTYGVVGGKNGIAIRYVPAPGVVGRPVIEWQDIVNQHPKYSHEVAILGELPIGPTGPGQSSNFETCAAVRILRASGITIEGIIIDGGSPAPFIWQGIWPYGDGSAWAPLIHGNAAIAIVVSGDVQIRDCEFRNAFIGMYVKDRNIGGVYGNPNPGDIETIIPLSNFGKTGNHLIEYNRIHKNNMGIYFESSWDLGSTIRYNLIYDNYTVLGPHLSYGSQEWAAGAIKFKDAYLSPVAVYNNTFFQNERDLYGSWQVGGQHLVFNNIFGGNRAPPESGPNYNYLAYERKLLHRMKHSVLPAARLVLNSIPVEECGGQEIVGIVEIVGIAGVTGAPMHFSVFPSDSYPVTVQCLPPIDNITSTVTGFLPPGAKINTMIGDAIAPPRPMIPVSADANLRWLQMAGGTFTTTLPDEGPTYELTLPSYFKSIDPNSPDFLVPDWDKPEVQEFIRNQGWPASGIINEDGTIADLGAIPYSGKRPGDSRAQTTRARIVPSDVVIVNGTEATAKFMVNQEIGTLSNLNIKYIRWIAPIPESSGNGGGVDINPILEDAIYVINTAGLPPLSTGPNEVKFTLPSALAANTEYGFFELVIEGHNVIGQSVTTDVGFLPFRQLSHYFDVKAFNQSGDPVSDVVAGEPVTIEVTARVRSTGAVFNTNVATHPMPVHFSLLSSATAQMYHVANDQPLVDESDLKTADTYSKQYTVYFTEAGNEVVSVAGAWCDVNCAIPTAQRLAFLGSLRLNVHPAEVDGVEAPARIAFLSPPSRAEAMLRGFYHVEVQVEDRFGNPVVTPVDVNIVSTDPGVGTVSPGSAATDPATGRAQFIAHATEGAAGNATFRLIASMNVGGTPFRDTVTLRIEPEVVVDPRPRIISGGYQDVDGFIYKARLGFDRAASHGWFERMTFIFGAVPCLMANPNCIELVHADESSVDITFGCGFPGSILRSNLGNHSRVTVHYNSTLGWAPQVVTIVDGRIVSVTDLDREVPKIPVVEQASVIPSVVITTGAIVAGPNPVSRQSGGVNLFWDGVEISSGKLSIYDASGNFIKKIKITDRRDSLQPSAIADIHNRRLVGEWNLRDRKGRLVSEGSYLIRGTVVTRGGKREKVSLILGVR